MATIHDVAQHARVSVGTVSRVLNEHPSVRPAVREAVLNSIRELGYFPNSLARSLRSSRTRTLGLIVSDLNNPPSISLLRGAEDAARTAGYTVLIAESRSDVEVESLHLQALLDRRVDGLLCAPVKSIELVARAAETAGIPAVMVSQRVAHARVPTAYVEESTSIIAAMDYLVDMGHRRFAMINRAGYPAGRARSLHIQAYLNAHAISTATAAPVLWSFAHQDQCEALVTRLLLGRAAPTALIVGGHHFLPNVLLGVRGAGMSVPRDVSLVAFGDSRWAQALTPPVSVITDDQEQHAADAVRMLLRLIEGDESAPRTACTPSLFLPRESCAPPPAEARP
jgi:LacI family transcriptional regulator